MAAIVAFPTSASAFECYNAIRSAQGDLSAAKSKSSGRSAKSWPIRRSSDSAPPVSNFVIAGLQDAGFRTDILINFHTIMASGLETTHPEKLQDGTGIDHLPEEFFATIDPLIEDAFANECA